MQDGLSNYKVNAICKDSNGFLWFGTNEGLNRFDGYNYKIYGRSNEEDAGAIFRTIRKIINKNRDELIIATDFGTYIYNIKTNSFNLIKCREGENCKELTWSVCLDSTGTIWMGTVNGLFYKEESDTLSNKFSKTQRWFKDYYVREVEILQKQKLYIGTKNDGLIIYDLLTKEYTHHRADPNNLKTISGNWIESIFEDSRGNIFIGTNDNGLNLYDPSSQQFYHYPIKFRSGYLYSMRIRDVAEDLYGNIWLGSSIGIFRKEKSSDEFVRYASVSDNTSILINNSIYDICIDNHYILWAGTFSGGVNYCDLYQKEFTNYEYRKNDNRFLNDRVVYSICEDEEYLWIATERRGINKYDKKTGLYEYISLSEHNLKSNNIKVIIQDSKKNLWLGTYRGGLVYYNTKKNTFQSFTHEKHDTNSLCNNNVYALCFDKDSNLWIGTREGVDRYDVKTGKFAHITTPLSHLENKTSLVVYKLYNDSKDNIWMGGAILGLYLFNRQKNCFEAFDEIFTSTSVSAIYEDIKGNTWAGASNGLYFIDRENDTILFYNISDGLPVNTVLTIDGDKQGNIWMSTTVGITRFNNAVNNPDNPDFVNFVSSDGISLKQFTNNSSITRISDIMFFGGVNGFISFNPKDIKNNPIEPIIKFTNFKVFNKDVHINKEYQGSVLLKESITTAQEIVLSHKHKIFTIEFAALHFSNPDKNKYKYRLEGFEVEWNYSGSDNRSATYTNLPGGKYNFIVYGANHDGVWSKKPAKIAIRIIPPFWKTFWFILFVFISVTFLVFLFIRWRTNDLNKRAQIMERAKLKAEESERLKSAFLANMSHEIRTPMNSIIGFSNFLADETDPEVRKEYIEVIRSSSESLMVLINDILEISQIESNQIVIYKSPFDAIQVLKELYMYYSLKDEKDVEFFLETSNVSKLILNTDIVRFKQIFTNLLNNAYKFTLKGFINFGFYIEQYNIVFYVKDTGIGIAEDKIDNIFNYFEKLEHSNQMLFPGTGIGLSIVRSLVELMGGKIWVSSQEKVGSSFFFSLPAGNRSLNRLPENGLIEIKPYEYNFDVVIVEDTHLNYRLLKIMLNEINLKTIFWAKNGYEIIDFLNRSKLSNPTVILMDIKMPKMDGFSALKEIRTFNNEIPVIAVTAFATAQDKAKILSLGFMDIVSKPIDKNELIISLNALMKVGIG